MNNFTFSYPVKQYFGKGCAGEALRNELAGMGDTVMLAYGKGSLKKPDFTIKSALSSRLAAKGD